MTSRRTEIRAALKSRLTGLAITGANVFDDNRMLPLDGAELPALRIVTGGEVAQEAAFLKTSLPVVNPLTMRVDILVKASGTFVDTANEILDQVRSALFDSTAHNTLGGLALSTRLESIDDPDVDDSLEKPAYRLPIILRVDYS